MSIVPVNRGKIEGQSHVGDVEIPKRIRKVQRAGFHGHLHVDFEDGTMRVLQKTEHEHLDLKPGDYFPPLPIAVPEVDGPVSAIEGGADASIEGSSSDASLQECASDVSPVMVSEESGAHEGESAAPEIAESAPSESVES